MKLKLDDVRVDSFTTAEAEPEQRGTVHGHERTLLLLTCWATCPGNETCPECPVNA